MDTRTRAAATVAGAAIVAYQALLVAAVAARPELDVVRKPVSEYAIGRHGWVAVTAFLVAALAYAALAVAVRPFVSGRGGRAGLALLWLCVLGTVGVGVFVADPVVTPVAELTTAGRLHVVCGLGALVLLPVAALLVTRDVAAHPAVPGGPGLRRVAALPLAALVAHWAVSAGVPPEGLPPRLLFLAYAAWLLVLAARLRPTGP
jgi:hypothetical protein